MGRILSKLLLVETYQMVTRKSGIDKNNNSIFIYIQKRRRSKQPFNIEEDKSYIYRTQLFSLLLLSLFWVEYVTRPSDAANVGKSFTC